MISGSRVHSLCIALALALAACVSRERRDAASAHDLGAMDAQIERVDRALERLEGRLVRTASEASAANPEGEFRELTIDSARLARPGETVAGTEERWLMCHVAEWRGFGKLLRFTRNADRRFYLESADGRAIEANLATGGVGSSDGSERYVLLRLRRALAPGVAYTVRARNANESYRWIVAGDVVAAADTSR